MSVAMFIYENIYCRYLCPGECIIHDRGSDFCNEVAKTLHGSFGVNIRISAAGRPQSNGQCEAMIKNIKEKMRAIMVEQGIIFIT